MLLARIHFIWIGSRPMPAWARRNIEEFRRLNPAHEVRVHGEEVLLDSLAAVYGKVSGACSKADLLRYSALRRYGGWYFDCDFWPLRPVADIERAYLLDGSRLFVTEQHGNRNPQLTLANGVLAASPDCEALQVLERLILETRPPYNRCSFGPLLMLRLQRERPDLLRVGAWPWFYPAEVGRAGRLYDIVRQRGPECSRHFAPTGGQVPFAMHLWAGGRTKIPKAGGPVIAHLNPNGRGPWSGRRATVAALDVQWRDRTQPFRAVAEGLAGLGFDVSVMRLGEQGLLDAADLVVLWNGRKGRWRELKHQARALGIPTIIMEHGFFDRRAYTQIDHLDILHWASWTAELRNPAPPEGGARLARVWPHRLRPFGGRDGYVLVLGQVPGDSQMQESEVSLPTPLKKAVARSLPRGVDAVFRPHPRAGSKRVSYLRRCEARTIVEAIEGARFAVMINSNAGNECLALGCPVLCLGPALYAQAGVAKQTRMSNFKRTLLEMLAGWRPDGGAVRNYLHWLACRQYNQQEMREGEVLARLLEKVMPHERHAPERARVAAGAA